MPLLGRWWKSAGVEPYRRGMAAYNAGHYDDARAEFDACLHALHQDSDPMRSLALFYAAEAEVRLAEVALAGDDPGAALAFATQATRRNPGFPEAHAIVGVAHALQGSIPDSVLALSTALALDPDHVEAHLVLGLVSRALDDPAADEAFAAVRARASITPRLPAACLRGVFAAFRGSLPPDLHAVFAAPAPLAAPMAHRAPAP